MKRSISIFVVIIGNSLTQGVEVFSQYSFNLFREAIASIFTSTSVMDAWYPDAQVRSGEANINIRGNKIESAPVCNYTQWHKF